MGRKRGRDEAVATNDSLTLLGELRLLYAEIDQAFSGWACDASTDCCRFGVTGREPYPTAIEMADLLRQLPKAKG